jgi:hypothetical protein
MTTTPVLQIDKSPQVTRFTRLRPRSKPLRSRPKLVLGLESWVSGFRTQPGILNARPETHFRVRFLRGLLLGLAVLSFAQWMNNPELETLQQAFRRSA